MSDFQINLRKHLPQPEAIRLITEDIARQYMVIPLAVMGDTLQVAMANPNDIFAMEALASMTRLRIEPEAVSAQEIMEAIDFNYKGYDEIEKKVSNISMPDELNEIQVKSSTMTDAPVAQALTMIIDEAVKSRASDVHLQPQEDRLRVRLRIDGTLHDMISLPNMTITPMISRVKVLAGMNIADHHRPKMAISPLKLKAGRLISGSASHLPSMERWPHSGCSTIPGRQ